MYKKMMESFKKAVEANLLRLIMKDTSSVNKEIYAGFLESMLTRR